MENTQENLPNWDLSDLYKGMDDPKIAQDKSNLGILSKKFEERYKGNVENLDGETFAKAIREYEKIRELDYKLGVYAFLNLCTDQTNSEKKLFSSAIDEKSVEISKNTLFFGLEINKLDDANIEKKLETPEANHYRPFVENVRAFKNYQLNDDLERLFVDKSQTSGSAWVKLYSEKMVRMRYEVDGKVTTPSEITKMMVSENAEDRKKAYEAQDKETKEHAWEFAMIMNNIAKDKAISDEWRSFEKPVSSRNVENNVEDEVVENLVSTVKDGYKNLTHRYYGLKADWMDKDNIEYWDRNNAVPIDGLEEKKYTWEEAKDIVFNAYNEFSPELAAIGKKFFDNNWIDVPPKDGKRGGAFACDTIPGSHPYLMLNFDGSARDVMTLAHELGHGVHQYLATNKQGMLMQETPLTLAETASVFGEMMTFRYMLKQENDPKRRFSLITGKVQDMLNTSVRQISFHDYETKVHDERKKGELSEEKFAECWTGSLKDSLGPKVNVNDCIDTGWAHIPHMFRTPFYVYAYSFGDCLVNSLYKTYEEGKVPDFQEKYKEMLSKGGSEKHTSILKPFGLSAKEPNFWESGLKVTIGLIDEAEKLGKELGLGKYKNKDVANNNAEILKKKLSNGRG